MSTHLGLILGVASMVLTGIGFSLYGWYARAKDYLIIDIRNVLEGCRALNSWDDRSEL